MPRDKTFLVADLPFGRQVTLILRKSEVHRFICENPCNLSEGLLWSGK